MLACQNGYFGQDCAKKCIETCDECNNINGLCNNGCLPGWSGHFCNQRLGIFHLIVFSLHLQYIQCSRSPFYNYLFLFRIPKFRTENQLEVKFLLSACYFVHFADHNWFTYCLQRGNKVNHFYKPYKLNKLTYSSRVY